MRPARRGGSWRQFDSLTSCEKIVFLDAGAGVGKPLGTLQFTPDWWRVEVRNQTGDEPSPPRGVPNAKRVGNWEGD